MSDGHLYMKNPGRDSQLSADRTGTLDFITSLDYSHLMSNVTGELLLQEVPSHPKFGYQTIHLSGAVQSETHLLWFLKSLRLLKYLDGSQFGQKFYDQLLQRIHWSEWRLRVYGKRMGTAHWAAIELRFYRQISTFKNAQSLPTVDRRNSGFPA